MESVLPFGKKGLINSPSKEEEAGCIHGKCSCAYTESAALKTHRNLLPFNTKYNYFEILTMCSSTPL